MDVCLYVCFMYIFMWVSVSCVLLFRFLWLVSMLMGQWEILWGVCWDLKRAEIGPIRKHVRECGLGTVGPPHNRFDSL